MGRDALLTAEILRKVGHEAEPLANVGELALALDQPTGLAIVAEEALDVGAIARLAELLSTQPSWSDLPFLIFSSSRPDAAAGAALLERLTPLGNVSLLERPIRVATLLSAVAAALRSRRRQYEVRDLLGRLEQAVRQRDQFLAILGHELRNPLSAALLASENLARLAEEPGEATRVKVEHQRRVIRRQLDLLTRLVDDLLEVSRVTSGKVQLRKRALELGELVHRTLESTAAQAEQQRLRLKSKIADEPVVVLGDPARLEQILVNLLRNSIKYTPPGGEIEVSLTRAPAEAVVVVRDTGVGLEQSALTEIFELFKQADHSLDRAQGGLGIGLTLVQTLVRLHGGRVVARSEGLGLGSEFEVGLPLADHAAVPVRASSAAPLLEATGGLLFVLEDHVDSREGLVGLLQRLGYEVESDGDGARGAERIAALRPRAAFVDIGLPGVDGYEVARRVRARVRGEVFLIALTGYGQLEDRKRALEAGFDAHATKPIDMARLRSVLARSARTPAEASRVARELLGEH